MNHRCNSPHLRTQNHKRKTDLAISGKSQNPPLNDKKLKKMTHTIMCPYKTMQALDTRASKTLQRVITWQTKEE